jgi:hypothetical protein
MECSDPIVLEVCARLGTDDSGASLSTIQTPDQFYERHIEGTTDAKQRLDRDRAPGLDLLPVTS